ncbi:MAG: discoidin domain-containing protein [Myxococcota bacterium]
MMRMFTMLGCLTAVVACSGDRETPNSGETGTPPVAPPPMDTGMPPEETGTPMDTGMPCVPEERKLIPDVTAVTTMGECCGGSIAAMLDGSGLEDEAHTCGDAEGWKSDGSTSGQITFDLQEAYALEEIRVWNHGQLGGDRGVANLAIFTSEDGSTYLPLTGAPSSLDAATSCPVTAQAISTNGQAARFVRFDVGSGHGAINVGLLEVQFGGTTCPD